MTEILSQLAEKSGLSLDQARKALGAVLAFLKQHLPEQAFTSLQNAVPGSAQLLADAPPEAPAEGGILSHAANWVSSLFGGTAGGATKLVQQLHHLGLSAEQVQSFLPRVAEFLKDKLPPEVAEKVTALLPGAGQPAATGG